MRSHQAIYIKALYFTIWGAIGAYWPFLYIYYTQIGLSGTQVGFIIVASSLCGTLSATLWGLLSDRTGRVRLIETILCAGLIASCLTLGMQRSLLGLMVTAGLFSFFASPILPLLDSTTLAMLEGRREQYGAYRAWGTIGFVITSAVMGALIATVGMHGIFWAYSGGVLIFALLVQWLPNKGHLATMASRAGMGTLIRQPAWRVFAGSVFLLWFSVMGAFAFLGIVVTQMGGTTQMVGLASTVAAFTEIPFLYFSSRILRRLGPTRLLIIAMAIYCFRLVLYTVMAAPSWVIWLALLQGASYGPYLLGAVAYADSAAPDGLKATSQGLFTSVSSLANLAAGVAAGWLLDHLGRVGLYGAMAGTCALALGLFVFGRPQTHAPLLNEEAEVGAVLPG